MANVTPSWLFSFVQPFWKYKKMKLSWLPSTNPKLFPTSPKYRQRMMIEIAMLTISSITLLFIGWFSYEWIRMYA